MDKRLNACNQEKKICLKEQYKYRRICICVNLLMSQRFKKIGHEQIVLIFDFLKINGKLTFHKDSQSKI